MLMVSKDSIKSAVKWYLNEMTASANANGPDVGFMLSYDQFVYATVRLLDELGCEEDSHQLYAVAGMV